MQIDFRLSFNVEKESVSVSYAPLSRENFEKEMKKLSLWQIGYIQDLLREIGGWAKKNRRVTVRKARRLAKKAQK